MNKPLDGRKIIQKPYRWYVEIARPVVVDDGCDTIRVSVHSVTPVRVHEEVLQDLRVQAGSSHLKANVISDQNDRILYVVAVPVAEDEQLLREN